MISCVSSLFLKRLGEPGARTKEGGRNPGIRRSLIKSQKNSRYTRAWEKEELISIL